MKKYLLKREVMAEPMILGEAVERKIYPNYPGLKKEELEMEGYGVRLKDGREFWRNKREFERDYRPFDTVVERLEVEYEELSEKCEKLNEIFLDREAVINKIGTAQWEMLQRQIIHMDDYRSVIGCRLYELGLRAMKNDSSEK